MKAIAERTRQMSADQQDNTDAAAALRLVNAELRVRGDELKAARAQLSDRQAEIAAIYDRAPFGMALFDRQGRFQRINPRMAAINGVPQDEHIGRTAREIAPRMAETAELSIAEVFDTGEPIRHDRVMGFLNDRSEDARVFDIEWYPVFRDGAVDGVGVLMDDATEDVRHDLFARHMVRELQHRVKNSLANVMALVEQASRSDRSKEEVLQVLKERLGSLALIHGKLTERNWESVGLSLLVSQEIGRDYRPSRIDVDGPDVAFGPQSSLAMAMALHELAANARRYGALSCASGGLSIHWKIVGDAPDGHLFLRWRETGCVTAATRRAPGFGSRLIATSVRNALRGELTEQWLDDGLCLDMKLPLLSVGPPAQEFTAGLKT